MEHAAIDILVEYFIFGRLGGHMFFPIGRFDVHWYILRVAEAAQMFELILQSFLENARVFQGQLGAGGVVIFQLLIGGKLGRVGYLRVRYHRQHSCFELFWARSGSVAGF